MKSKKKAGGAAVAPTAVTDLAVVEDFCGEPLTVTSVVRGRQFQFRGRRLLPEEASEVKLILESAVPPVIKEEGKPDRYDLQNPDYRRAQEDAWGRGRALALFCGFPCFREQAAKEAACAGGPPPKNATEMARWLGKRKLEPDLLDGLFSALTREEVQSYLGFTSGSSSPKS
jgi:hypothetical protein